MPQGPKVVAGFQRDVRTRLVVALAPGALAWGIGATLLLFGLDPYIARGPTRFTHRSTLHIEGPLPEERPNTLLVGAGALLCLVSPFVFAFGLRRSLDNDHYLLFRTDGLVRRTEGVLEVLLWDDIEDASVDDAGRIVVRLRDDEFFVIDERFIGVTSAELAAKIREVRRKAVWGLLAS